MPGVIAPGKSLIIDMIRHGEYLLYFSLFCLAGTMFLLLAIFAARGAVGISLWIIVPFLFGAVQGHLLRKQDKRQIQ